MKRFFSILITSIVLTAVIKYEAQSLSCLPCGYDGPCEDPKCCESESYHPAVCNCCRVCAKRHNEYCGGSWNFGGSCDVGLSCVTQCRSCKTEKDLDCIFPFKYNGTTYNACTDVESANNKIWCATEVDGEGKIIDGQWDNCGPSCPTKDFPCHIFNLYNEGGRCLNKTETQIVKARSGDLVIIEDGVSNADPAPHCDKFGNASAQKAGGYSPVTDPKEIKRIGEESLPFLTSYFGPFCKLHIRKVENMQKQIVAGVNYRFDAEIRSSGERCVVDIKLCTGIVVFEPLPFRCPDPSENNHCLQLSPQSNIRCSLVVQ